MELIESILNEEEDHLPDGWEERVTPYGKVYYANHLTKTTQWEHPTTGKEKYLSGELPYGWERKIIDNDTIIYVDHINHKTSYTDPRLAFSKPSSKKKMNSYFSEYSTALDILKSRDLSGLYAIVVGANHGVGLEIVRALSYTGCHVILACRNLTSAQEACESLIKDRPDIKLEVLELNLDSFLSVKNFADKFKSRNIPLNMLFLNAAIFESEHKLSKDNLEIMFQVNYLSQFYLARLLMKNLIETPDSRLVVLGCESHRGGNLTRSEISANTLSVNKSDFNSLQVFCNTKLCNILFANELNRRINKIGSLKFICKSCHPGNLLPTKLFCNWFPFRYLSIISNRFSKSLPQAAASPVLLATVNENFFRKESFYFNSLLESSGSEEANDQVLAYRLWEISEAILIDHTSHFDSFLADGDQFSSYTKIDTPKSLSPIN